MIFYDDAGKIADYKLAFVHLAFAANVETKKGVSMANDENKPEGGESAKKLKLDFTHLPSDAWGLVGLLLLCGTVLLTVWWILQFAGGGGKAEIGFSEIKIAVDGPNTDIKTESETRLLQFWTPSDRTKDSLCDDPSGKACVEECKEKLIDRADRWECYVEKEDVEKFEDALAFQYMTQDSPVEGTTPIVKELVKRFLRLPRDSFSQPGTVTGFHHYPEVGQSYLGKRKEGLWWEMTVKKDFDLRVFAQFYARQWCKNDHNYDYGCATKDLYIEQINGSAGVAPRK